MSIPTKIASRLKSATTGEEFYIGTVGLVEKVTIKLTSPTTVDWTQLHVTVQNISAATSQEILLSGLGECTFQIPMGELYEVTLPEVGDYTQPSVITYTATSATRNIQHTYSHEAINLETIVIIAHVVSAVQSVSVLEDLTVYAQTTDGYYYSTQFNSQGRAQLTVPYGKSYTLTIPEVEGLVHDHQGEHHIAGVTSREVLVHYSEQPLGCFGIDANGHPYTAEEIAELQDKSIIVFVGYNDSALANGNRGDGTRGCGFMWKVTSEVASKSWSNQNIEFDHNRLPYVSSEAAAASVPYSGRYYTQVILEILEDMQTDSENPNPNLTAEAASYCASRSAECNGVDLQGFMGNFIEYKRAFVLNKQLILDVYAALGLSAPQVWSGIWWTAYQWSAQNAVHLYLGGFNINSKHISYSVLPLYDLIINF